MRESAERGPCGPGHHANAGPCILVIDGSECITGSTLSIIGEQQKYQLGAAQRVTARPLRARAAIVGGASKALQLQAEPAPHEPDGGLCRRSIEVVELGRAAETIDDQYGAFAGGEACPHAG
jgi:hypothetical protein